MNNEASAEKFRVIKDFPCGDGGVLKRNSEVILDGTITHPDLVDAGAMKAVVKFGLIEKPDGKCIHLNSKQIDEARLEPERQVVIVPGDFESYFEQIR